jgi:pimeloyl-ACP methyl ester carboxylesterase
MKPRLLVVPGLDGDPGLLRSAEAALFRGFRPLWFDHRLDDVAGGVDGLAERAVAILDSDEEHDTPAFVCGESFGGTVALTAARLQPPSVKGLILFSTFGWHPSMLARRGVPALALWTFLGQRVSGGFYRAGRLASVPTQLGLRFPPDLLREYIERPRAHVAAYRTKAELALTFDARPWLGEINCPAFVLVGSWDPVVPASAGRELARRLPDATLHSLRGGHLVHLVQAARVRALLEAWARRVHLRQAQ